MFDSDGVYAASGSAGRGSIDPRPSGLSPSVVPPTTLAGCQQGGPPVRAGGSLLAVLSVSLVSPDNPLLYTGLARSAPVQPRPAFLCPGLDGDTSLRLGASGLADIRRYRGAYGSHEGVGGATGRRLTTERESHA